MNKINPDPDKFAKLIKEHSGPIVMLNLLKFRAKAPGEEGTGAEAYRRYGSRVVKMIEAVGGKVLWSGRPESVLIGDSSDEWDAVALVQYPSPSALFYIGFTPQYQQI